MLQVRKQTKPTCLSQTSTLKSKQVFLNQSRHKLDGKHAENFVYLFLMSHL